MRGFFLESYMNIKDYELEGQSLYADFSKTVASILGVISAQVPRLHVQQIQSRAKKVPSLRLKLEKLGLIDSDCVEMRVKDLAGCRIVCYTDADVTRFTSSGAMQANFEIDWDRTKIHHPVPDGSGTENLFQSINYVLRLTDARMQLPEYSRFAGLHCEVQVQTTLKHAWAEMEHDLIYKRPALQGFGEKLLDGIEARMRSIMRDHLMPASHEFQKVVSDFERMAAGIEIVEAGPMKLLGACSNNNERYDLLERIENHVLPYYEDVTATHRDWRSTLVACIESAWATETNPIATPFGEIAGYSTDAVSEKCLRLLQQIQFIDRPAVEETFDALLRLYLGNSNEKWRQRILRMAHEFAKLDRRVWAAAGPGVQELVVARAECLETGVLTASAPLLATMLSDALGVEVTGTTSSYEAVSIHSHHVQAGPAVTSIRSRALAILKKTYRLADSDLTRKLLIDALFAATKLPYRGVPSDSLVEAVLESAADAIEFLAAHVNAMPLPLLEATEDRVHGVHRQNRFGEVTQADGPIVAKARARVSAAIDQFRQATAGVADFEEYCVLVGFRSNFPPAWDGPNFGPAEETEYRRRAIDGYVADLSEANLPRWVNLLKRLATFETGDMASFQGLRILMEELGNARADLLRRILLGNHPELERFIPTMLHGLAAGPQRGVVYEFIDGSITTSTYLPQVTWYLSVETGGDTNRLKRAFDAALQSDDEQSVANLLVASTSPSNGNSSIVEDVLLPGIEYLSRKDPQWRRIGGWTFHLDPAPFRDLTEEQARRVLNAFVAVSSIDYHLEDLLSAVAVMRSRQVIEYFERRIPYRASVDDGRYEAIPYQFHTLHKELAKHLGLVLEAVRSWSKKWPKEFSYRADRFVALVFPELTDELKEALVAIARNEGEEGVEFLIAILDGYEAHPNTHEVYKEIVANLPEDSLQLGSIETRLDATGVVRGEFGFVAAYQEKKDLMESWLADPRLRVVGFAKRHIRTLEREIAAEQRRAEESHELRKRNFPKESNE
ncbi:hypothetical protein BWI17_06845 [Betaproteobacteria bacterium GR16-43]|nr:hypothetical protein BWI17_06845 [Betaproteobacteria bacterium GR16-43]